MIKPSDFSIPAPTLRRVVGAAAFILILCACAGGDNDDGPSAITLGATDTGVATSVPMPAEDGTLWCARLPDPHMCFDSSMGDGPNVSGSYICTEPPGDDAEVNEDPPDGGDPEGCECACPEIDTMLTDLPGTNAFVDDSELPPLTTFRDNVYVKAVEKCENLVAFANPQPDFNNCEYALNQHLAANPNDYPELTPTSTSCVCMAMFVDENADGTAADPEDGAEPMPEDKYGDYYNLSSVIVWNSSEDQYDIDRDFFYDVLQNPGWLLWDNARIIWDPDVSAFRLTGVSGQTIAGKLGLQNGDIIKKVNALDVGTVDQMLDVYRICTVSLSLRSPSSAAPARSKSTTRW
jgi:hypothetical protein